MCSVRGPPLDIWGGGGALEFLPDHFYLFHKGDGKLYFYHLRVGCISTMPCGHLFISSIFPTKIFISKKLQRISTNIGTKTFFSLFSHESIFYT